MDAATDPAAVDSAACPHLGLAADRATHFGYPSFGNCCFGGGAPAHVALEHQGLYCLAVNHLECPVYRGAVGTSPGRLVGSGEPLRSVLPESPGARGLRWLGITLGGVALGVAGLAAWLIFAGPLPETPPATPVPTPAATAVPPTGAPAVAASATVEATATARATATPLPTASATAVAAGAPVGPFSLVAYEVQALDTLAIIAYDRQTTTAVLRLANGLDSGDVLQVGQVLVVPVGVTSAQGVPRFEVHWLGAAAAVADLAAELEVGVRDLMWVNALEQPLVPAGRLLFVPRAPRPTSTPTSAPYR